MNADILKIPELKVALEVFDRVNNPGRLTLETKVGHKLDIQINRANLDKVLRMVRAAVLDDWRELQTHE